MDHSGYGNTARLLHWLMAALILLTVPAGLVMVQDELPRNVQDALFLYHKNVGVLLLLLTVARLLVRWRWPPPPQMVDLPRWQRGTGLTTHCALYGLLLIVTVAGFVRVRADGYPIEILDLLGVPVFMPQSSDLAATAKALHYWAGLAMMAMMALHIGAALFHAIVRRDGVFTRMWPPLVRHRQ